jgi:hypothetical protein
MAVSSSLTTRRISRGSSGSRHQLFRLREARRTVLQLGRAQPPAWGDDRSSPRFDRIQTPEYQRGARGTWGRLIAGYKPAFNFQLSLVDAVARWFEHHPDWLAPATRLHAGGTRTALRDDAMLWIGPPPTHSNAPPPDELEQMTAIARKYDVAERDARNEALGRAGEERVLAHERASLLSAGRTDSRRPHPLGVACRWRWRRPRHP